MIFNWSLTRRGKMSCKSFLIKTVSRQIRCLFVLFFLQLLFSFLLHILKQLLSFGCSFKKPFFSTFKPPCCLSVILGLQSCISQSIKKICLFQRNKIRYFCLNRTRRLCLKRCHICSFSNSNFEPYEMAHQMLNIITNFGWIIAELNVKIFTVIVASFAVA